MIIITPCSRPENLFLLKDSIKVKHTTWYIVYDSDTPIQTFKHELNIIELNIKGGMYGNKQRNLALDTILNNNIQDFIYFLDDDNVIHPEFETTFEYLYSIPTSITNLITFDQETLNGIRKGNILIRNNIDTAQFIAHTKLISNTRWDETLYNADGKFIEDLIEKAECNPTYIPNILSYYNRLIW